MSQPLDHPRASEAIEFLLGTDDPASHAAFERELARDAALRAAVDAIAETMGLVALDAPQVSAPAAMRDQVLAMIAQTPQEPATSKVVAFPKRFGAREALAWVAAIVFVATGAWLWTERAELSQQLAASQAELRQAREAGDLAKMEIGTLKATLAEYEQGVAVVVWDANTQQGILKLEKMPPLSAEKDYQLWVVDSSYKNPVDAGIVRVDAGGFANVKFKPLDPIRKAEKFALSVEKRGGVPVAEGPIVLLSP